MSSRIAYMYRSVVEDGGTKFVEVIQIGGKADNLVRSLQVRHDIGPPCDFGWGRHAGLRHKQLAVALLAHCIGITVAKAYAWDFVLDVVSRLNENGFTIFSWQIEEWLDAKIRAMQE